MAVVQRKLVHKQFNSPIGLYSKENVKETLHRELKAFGADGIQIDDPISKPLNLANSAVLRAVEEEDQQIKCGVVSQRQSRPRHRFYNHHTPLHQQQLKQIKTEYLSHQHDVNIDRDTVLKINRLATRRNLHKRDHSWPPPPPLPIKEMTVQGENDSAMDRYGLHARSSSNDNAIHFDMSVCRRHEIDALREKFNSPTRVIELTAAEVRRHRKLTQQQRKSKHHQAYEMGSNKSLNGINATTPPTLTAAAMAILMTNDVNNKAHTSSTKLSEPPDEKSKNINTEKRTMSTDAPGRPICATSSASCVDDMHVNAGDVDALRTTVVKGVSAPETNAADENIGLVEPKRQYYEQLATRRWHSIGNIIVSDEQGRQSMIPLRPDVAGTRTIINNHRQSCSLDRGRARQERSQQLPPLKPRTSSIGGGIDGSTTTTGRTSKSPKSPKLQRRSIKLATEIKIHYDTDADDTNAESTIISCTKLSTPQETNQQQPKSQMTQMTTVANLPTISYSNLARLAENQQLNKSISVNELAVASLSDLEHIPLPPTPTTAIAIAKTLTKPTPLTVAVTTVAGEDQQLAGSKASAQKRNVDITATTLRAMTAAKAAQQCTLHTVRRDGTRKRQLASHSHKETHNRNEVTMPSTRLIPVTVEKRNDVDESRAENKNLLSYTHSNSHSNSQPKDITTTLSAQKIYDDACIYLRSIDLQDNTVAYIPAAITIVPSPTEDILLRWADPENLKANIKSKPNWNSQQRMSPETPPTPPPPPPIPPPPPQPAYLPSLPPSQQTSCSLNKSTITPMPLNLKKNEDLQRPNARVAHIGECEASKNKTESITKTDNSTKSPNISSELVTEMPTYITRFPATETAGGIQLSRQTSVPCRKSAPSTPQTPDPIALMGLSSESLTAKTAKHKVENTTTETILSTSCTVRDCSKNSNEPEKKLRRRGIYYTDGEHLFGPFQSDSMLDPWQIHVVPLKETDKMPSINSTENPPPPPPPPPPPTSTLTFIKSKLDLTGEKDYGEKFKSNTSAHKRAPEVHTNQSEIASLEAKYGEIQQSISEHLRQIETYMQNAKLALNRTLQQQQHHQTPNDDGNVEESKSHLTTTASQSPVLVIETPLQAVLRQIREQQKCEISKANDKDTIDSGSGQTKDPTAPIENMPVVEQALLDLATIKETTTTTNCLQSKYKCNESSGLQPLLKRLIALRSPTSFELIELEHAFAPSADLPTHVTIDDEDGDSNSTDYILTPPGTQLRSEGDINKSEIQNSGNHQKVVEIANMDVSKHNIADELNEKRQMENVHDMAAKYEQLSYQVGRANSSKTSSFEEKLCDKSTPLIESAAQTSSPNDNGGLNSVRSAIEWKKLPEHECKNLISAFVGTRQDHDLEQEQVSSDSSDARNNQQKIATSSSVSITTTDGTADFHLKQTEQSQQQSSNCREYDGKIMTTMSVREQPAQPLKNIISTQDNKIITMQFASSSSPSSSSLTCLPQQDERKEEILQNFNADNADKHDTKKADLPKEKDFSKNVTYQEIGKEIRSTNDENHLSHCHEHASNQDNGYSIDAAASCPICGIKSTWGKMTFADQWRIENLCKTPVDDIFDTYQATYEIPSPYVSRQISWDDTLDLPATQKMQKNQVQITHEIATDIGKQAMIATVTDELTKADNEMQSASRTRTSLHWTPSLATENNTELMHAGCSINQTTMTTPISAGDSADSMPNETALYTTATRALTPTRRYPAPLIEPDVPKRAASPFGLNVVDISAGGIKNAGATSKSDGHRSQSPMPLAHESQYAYVPQVEGHNIGLLVRTITDAPSTEREWSRSPNSLQQHHHHKSKTGLQSDNTTTIANSNDIQEYQPDDVELHRFNSIVTSSKIVDDTVHPHTGAQTIPLVADEAAASSTTHGHIRANNRKCGAEWASASPRPSSSPSPLPTLFEYSMHGAETQTASTSSSYSIWPTIVTTMSPTATTTYVNTRDQSSALYNLGYLSKAFPPTYQRAFEDSGKYKPAHMVETEANANSNVNVNWNAKPTAVSVFSSSLHASDFGSANAINRSFHNVSPRPYNTIEGYKRVAWPPVSEERIVKEFTPQPQPQQSLHPEQQHQPTQGAIYNNKQPNVRQSSPYPTKYQQSQHNEHHQCEQYQPTSQHTREIQLKRQSSNNPIVEPHQPLQQHNGQQHKQPQEQYQTTVHRYESSSSISSSWKPIRPPMAKHQQQYTPNSNSIGTQPNYSSYAPPARQQSVQYQQPQNYQQQSTQQPQLQQQQQQYHHQQQYQKQQQLYQQHQQDQIDFQQQNNHIYRCASPGIITLRKEVPVSQKPTPVYTSQPAAVSYHGGSNMRGDLKWPPQEYKEAAERENEERRKIAAGPVCRPRRVNRDYTSFFARNALSHHYPSYKVPPGTQHIYG